MHDLLCWVIPSYFCCCCVTQTDPSLIGGMTVSVGDKFIDMSIVRRLDRYTRLVKGAV